MFYKNINSKLNSSESIKTFDNIIEKNDKKVLFYGMNRSTKSVLLSRAFTQQDKNIIFVTVDDKVAEDYLDDLILLTGIRKSHLLPDYEVLPYEERSPHYMIRAQRIETLSQIVSGEKGIYSLSLRSFLRIIVSAKTFKKNVINLKKYAEYNLKLLVSNLVGLGYQNEFQVAKVGDLAHRGGIVDVFSPNYSKPVRLEFFGDEITSIRFFDVESQRSYPDNIEKVTFIPSREFSLHDIETNDVLWEKIHENGFYEGIELDVALLLKKTGTLLDFFNPENCLIFWDEFQFFPANLHEIQEETTNLWQKALTNRKKDIIPTPDKVFQNDVYLKQVLKNYQTYFLSTSQQEFQDINYKYEIHTESHQNLYGNLELLEERISNELDKNYTVIIQSDNKSQSKRMRDLLPDFDYKIDFVIGVFQGGFTLPDASFSVYTDHEIFSRYRTKKNRAKFSQKQALVDYDSLKPGDYIVHINHGIGIFMGLKKIKISGNLIEYITIQYANNDRVYVPTYELSLVSKFVSEEGIKPKIHSLGSKKWHNEKSRAKKQIELVAEDLIKLYAERKLRRGIAFSKDTHWQAEMEESFIFDETVDQLKAIEDIKNDMEADNPMERLLCGDVGFGKTEVAIRAAFKAVMDGFQVAVLVPTTLLAEQHYLVFKERIAQYPVNISMFSRFRTTKQLKNDIESLANGQIDIAIGTHRLFSKDVKYKKLGLLIIDEEHRFGVRHKDKLRKLKTNVDTLYMSATPIPRTFYMALSKLKEMSLIQTSPKARLPIRTVIVGYDEQVIRDAILREVDRGGQVFFVHNRVQTIESVAFDLRKLLPNVNFAIGHGQLPERHLEKIMLDFSHHKFDVLIATTIIESGIDIPNANTIIVNRADMFGLAQLYQIRGRVGRSNRRAYAYLVIPPKLHDEARKRLETLIEYESLGSGYQIALRDMELRGAGSLVGTKQSGVINSIGFNYYNRLIEQAINNIQDEKENIWEEKKESIEHIHLDIDYFLPSEFISDEKEKLLIYKRLLIFEKVEDFDVLKMELEDRFGEIPKEALYTLEFYKLRMLSKQAKIIGINIRNDVLIIEFDNKNLPSRKIISELLSKFSYPVKFENLKNLKIIFEILHKTKLKLLTEAILILEYLINSTK
ncbi:MAG: transcription-repair coupling factor [Candidatus Cloacimonetes bacterium]|nr:transcription-repair coupling factor [Candidatus Cloacimonadota bacterium]